MVDFTKSWDEIVELNEGVPFEKAEQEVDTKKFQEQALDTLTTKDFVNTLKDYYTYRDGNDFQYTDDADVLDYFYSDRTWRNNNTVSMTRDLATVMGEDDDVAKLHNKGIIVDGQSVLVSSINMGSSAMNRNREMGVIIHSPVITQYYLDGWHADWNRLDNVTDTDQDSLTDKYEVCLLYTSPSPRDVEESRMPSSA